MPSCRLGDSAQNLAQRWRMCKLYPYNAFTTAPGGLNPAAGHAALRARSSNVRARRYGDRLDEWWLDGRQPHVGALAAPGAPGAGILGPVRHAGSRPERQRIVRTAPALGGREPAEVREEGVEEVRREWIEEDREEGGRQIDEEVGEEVGEEIGSQVVGAETREEESIGAERGQPRRAQAAGQEARAPLKQ